MKGSNEPANEERRATDGDETNRTALRIDENTGREREKKSEKEDRREHGDTRRARAGVEYISTHVLLSI